MPPPTVDLGRIGLYLSGLGKFLFLCSASSKKDPNVTFYLPTPMLVTFLSYFPSKSLWSRYDPGGGSVFF